MLMDVSRNALWQHIPHFYLTFMFLLLLLCLFPFIYILYVV